MSWRRCGFWNRKPARPTKPFRPRKLALDITTAQYKAGTATYLQVETSQTALFAEQKALVDLLTRRMVSSVLLVEALGGGWDTSQLPVVSELSAGRRALKTDRKRRETAY